MEAMENKAHTILHTPLGVHGPQVKNPCSAEKKQSKRNRGKIKSLGRHVRLAYSSADRLEKCRTEDWNSVIEGCRVQT